MALSLSTELANAQDNQSRHPIIELISSQTINDIPFDGQGLTSSGISEWAPNVITHSSGRMCLAYSREHYLYFAYTDVDRTFFTIVSLADAYGYHDTIQHASLCEMADGNIGIITVEYVGYGVYLQRLVVSPTGEIIANADIIASDSGYHMLDPFVMRMSNGTYLLVYEYFDGTNYYLSFRTSTNFLTWSAATNVNPTGLTLTYPKYRPSLMETTDHKIFCWFDYREALSGVHELTNIYYMTSSNFGSTWSSPTKVTSFTDYNAVGNHAIAVQKTAGQMHLIFNEVRGALHIDSATAGWCGGGDCHLSDFVIDKTNRKVYMTSIWHGAGTKDLSCVIEVDVDAWTITNCWDCGTSPGFPAHYCDGSTTLWMGKSHGEGHIIPVPKARETYQLGVSVIDAEANDITVYEFLTYAPRSVVANVTGYEPVNGEDIGYCWYDESSNRLWLCLRWSHGSGSVGSVRIGYLELGSYAWNELLYDTDWTGWQTMGLWNYGKMIIDSAGGRIIVSTGHASSDLAYKGRCKVYDINTGGMIKDYNWDDDSSFPYAGLHHAVVVGNKIWGPFVYNTFYSESIKRGLCCIDMSTDTITYHRPDWDTLDSYGMIEICASEDGRLFLNCYGYGVTVYNPDDSSWLLFNNANVPGLIPSGDDTFYGAIAFWDEEGLIFSGNSDYADSWTGMIMFYEVGFFRQARYAIGTETGGTYVFADDDALCDGYSDYNLVAALDPVNSAIYAFWVHDEVDLTTLYWDKEGSSLDLYPYLLRGEDVVFKRSIDGNPNTLEFSVSHGHLFDPQNSTSLWSIYLKKFRKVNLRMGENVGGTAYYHQMGVFLVVSTSIAYQRPSYPTMHVVAEDYRAMWEVGNICATEYYQTDPKTILEDILTTFSNLAISQLDVPTFDDSVNLYYQWVEQSLKDIIDQICERFCYFPRIDVDGKFTAKKSSVSAAVDHTYSDLTKVVQYSPDDSFSDFTNRITVMCEGREDIEILYAEEMITSLSGTVGWWGPNPDHEVKYSEDSSRRCRYPRLKIIESTQSIAFALAGKITEEISEEDPYEKWCIVSINVPSLIIEFLAALACLAASYFIPDTVNLPILQTVRVGTFVSSFCLYAACFILGAVGNYQIEVWARPVGKVKQTYQYSCDDDELQQLLGMVIEKKYTDPLCYTQDQCRFVATNEMMVTVAQRNRIRLVKVAHLQDEEGDTIQINHPFTGLELRIFLTDITRKFKMPSDPGGTDGYFIDELEGWKLT